jgi:7-carboxy-7-deazaguanine synthase
VTEESEVIHAPVEPKPGHLRVAESYLCLEGEGLTMGAPTYLVRLSGCNLRCWWCDTKFASFEEMGAKEIPWEQVRDEAISSKARWVSFTGGEPTFRGEGELADLARLCRALRVDGLKVKLETNGLLMPESLVPGVDLWTVSPKWDGRKTGGGQCTPLMRYDPAALVQATKVFPPPRLQFKFVITAGPDGEPKESDLARVEAMLKEIPELKSQALVLVPEGLSQGVDYLQRCRRLNEAVREQLATRWANLDVRVLPQWHRFLYGEERGK